MNRLLFILALAGTLALGTAFAAAGSAPRPNLLLFLVDDMGPMDSSQPFLADAAGEAAEHPLNSFYRTPSMERLAAHGLRFSQFYANSVCSPTRVSLMTGQSSARHRTTQWINPGGRNTGKLGPDDWNWEGPDAASVTLPRLLQQAGYRTIHAGKGHFGPLKHDGEDPRTLGFDINIGGCSYGHPGSYYGSDNFSKGGKPGNWSVPGLEPYHGKEIFLTEALTLEINKAIREAVADGKPFFAYMSHYAVHAPFMPDPRFAGHYAQSDKPPNARSFATMIEGMDKSLGDILDQLEALGVAENTLVVFLGDNGSDAPLGKDIHGYSSSAPLRGKKGTHYEGGMRVPFIVGWAEADAANPLQQRFTVAPGLLADEFASVCDIFPTLLELAGLKAPQTHTVDGHSLLASFGGERKQLPQTFLMHFPHAHRSSYFTVYREGAWKLVYHYTEPAEKRFELFNLDEDPCETTNRAESAPRILERLLAGMERELKDADALYPKGVDPERAFKLE